MIGIDTRKEGAITRIARVHPGSAAELAGIERGDILQAVNHRAVPNGRLCREIGSQLLLTIKNRQGEERDLTVTCAPATDILAFQRIIPNGKGPLGYLYLPSFGRYSFTGVVTSIEALSRQGVKELVLDLRDNGGGLLKNEEELAGMLLGPRQEGKALHSINFGRKYRDKDQKVPVPRVFASLSLERLVVITSEDTCSASELLINDLKPFIWVRTVGEATCGKPMMMETMFVGTVNTGSRLNLISALLKNSQGGGDYFSGIKPDCPVQERVWYNLGDPRENQLHEALQLLSGGTCRQASLRPDGA
jgi:C-terminal processing protease CtpA/Prc